MDVAPTRPLAGIRVLLAEDTPVNEKLVRLVLKKAGSEVFSVKNGAGSLRNCCHAQFRSDSGGLHTPVLDGLGATRLIRALDGKNHLPILALTASAFQEDWEASLAAGMNDFLTKPIIPALLERCVFWTVKRAQMKVQTKRELTEGREVLLTVA